MVQKEQGVNLDNFIIENGNSHEGILSQQMSPESELSESLEHSS